eukprot:465904_1
MAPFHTNLLFTSIILLTPSYSVPVCGYEDITNTTYVCNCIGDQACKFNTITCMNNTACRVKCSGKGACWGAIIKWPSLPGTGTLICDGIAMYICRGVNFPIPSPYEDLSVVCDQPYECRDADIYCPLYANCHIRCDSLSSCLDARFHWSMNDVQSTLECAEVNLPCIGANLPPSVSPSTVPTQAPTIPSIHPSVSPSMPPTVLTISPTSPSSIPTENPTIHPSATPTVYPTATPSIVPLIHPSATPTVYPTATPSIVPLIDPTSAVRDTDIDYDLIIGILSAVVGVLCICCCLIFVVFSRGMAAEKKFVIMLGSPKNASNGVQSETDTCTFQTEDVASSLETRVHPGPGAVEESQETSPKEPHEDEPSTDLDAWTRVKTVSMVQPEYAEYNGETPQEIQMMDTTGYDRQKSVSIAKQMEEDVSEIQQWLGNVLKLPQYVDAFIVNG